MRAARVLAIRRGGEAKILKIFPGKQFEARAGGEISTRRGLRIGDYGPVTMDDNIDGAGVLEAFSGSLGSMMLPVDRLFDGVADVVFFVKDMHGR